MITFVKICSNLTSFTLRLAKNEQLHPNDVVSLASLANLEKLTINKFDIEQDGPEMTEAFAILGQTERAFPFKQITFHGLKFDATPFFSSHRCHNLQHFEIHQCEFPNESFVALATNSGQSLEELEIDDEKCDPIRLLLPFCSKIKQLCVWMKSNEILKEIGKHNNIPILRIVTLVSMWDSKIDDNGFKSLVSALSTVTKFCVFVNESESLTAECVAPVALKCPMLRTLYVSHEYLKQVSHLLRSSQIDVTNSC